MPKDPIKDAMGFGQTDWGPLPDWMRAAGGWLGGQLQKAEGSAPHKVMQGIGTALDYADIAPEEQLTAPWYQRALSGVLDPGGRVGIAQDMAKKMLTGEQFDVESYREKEALGGLLPDVTPGPISAGTVVGGTKPLRKAVAKATREARQHPGLATELRKTASKKHQLSYDRPKGLRPDPPGFQIQGAYAPPKERLLIDKGDLPGEIYIRRGGPDLPSTINHEAILHRAEATLSPYKRARVSNALVVAGPHPRAKHYPKDRQTMESFVFGAQEILDGKPFTGSTQLEDVIWEIIGDIDQPTKGFLSDFGQSLNVPLTEVEIGRALDPLEKVMGVK
jgi:hypothetical protein